MNRKNSPEETGAYRETFERFDELANKALEIKPEKTGQEKNTKEAKGGNEDKPSSAPMVHINMKGKRSGPVRNKGNVPDMDLWG